MPLDITLKDIGLKAGYTFLTTGNIDQEDLISFGIGAYIYSYYGDMLLSKLGLDLSTHKMIAKPLMITLYQQILKQFNIIDAPDLINNLVGNSIAITAGEFILNKANI